MEPASSAYTIQSCFPLPGVHDLVKTRVHRWFPVSFCSSQRPAVQVRRPARGGGGRGGRGRGDGGGAVPVVTTKVAERDVPVDLAAIGNVEAYTTISVRSQVTGVLQEAAFREGDFVKKGQVLFRIDRRPFEAALAAGRGQLRPRSGAPQPGGSAARARRRATPSTRS